MNFYLGDSIEELDIEEKNIELDDDLFQFIYNSRNKLENKLQALFEIDQYTDVLIPLSKVEDLKKACTSLLDTNILTDYEDYEEAKVTIMDLIELCNKACTLNIGLISIGD